MQHDPDYGYEGDDDKGAIPYEPSREDEASSLYLDDHERPTLIP